MSSILQLSEMYVLIGNTYSCLAKLPVYVPFDVKELLLDSHFKIVYFIRDEEFGCENEYEATMHERQQVFVDSKININ